MRGFQLHFDRDYGCLKRTGWSIFIDYKVYAELEPYLVVAVVKALRRYWRYRYDS